jgi:hypothetical protein
MLERGGERRRNSSEHGRKLRTDERNRSDDHDGDESGDQTVLDGGARSHQTLGSAAAYAFELAPRRIA